MSYNCQPTEPPASEQPTPAQDKQADAELAAKPITELNMSGPPHMVDGGLLPFEYDDLVDPRTKAIQGHGYSRRRRDLQRD